MDVSYWTLELLVLTKKVMYTLEANQSIGEFFVSVFPNQQYSFPFLSKLKHLPNFFV